MSLNTPDPFEMLSSVYHSRYDLLPPVFQYLERKVRFENNSTKIPGHALAMAVLGKPGKVSTLHFGEEFRKLADDVTQGFIILHEMVHVFMRHGDARQTANKSINMPVLVDAQELECNSFALDMVTCHLPAQDIQAARKDIVDRILSKVPNNGHFAEYRPTPLPHGLSAQEYYDILINEPRTEHPSMGFDVIIVSGGGQGNGAGDEDVKPMPSDVPEDIVRALEKLDQIVSVGDHDLLLSNMLSIRSKPRPNFQLWNRFLTRMYKDAYGEVEAPSFRTADPRLCNIDLKGMRLPYNAKQHDRGALPTVWLYLDASGSMAQEELTWACTIAASIPTSKFNLIIHPFRRHVEDRVPVSKLLTIASHGGTSFNRVAEHFLTNAKDTDYAFVFSDGDDDLDVNHERSRLMSRVTWFLNTTGTDKTTIVTLKRKLESLRSASYTEEFFK